ncbi:MAG: hypothetical protein HYX35_01970 [Proteobacteria bacterium]|nr:hypothetical protein [Pseudomonadota bacterium]
MSEPVSSSGGSMGSGGGGGRASASEEGVVLPSDAVKEYEQLKAEKVRGKIPAPPPISSQEQERMAKLARIPHAQDSISSEALEQAKMNLKKVEQATVPAQTKESSSKEASSKTVASSSKPESVVTPSAEKHVQKTVSLSTTGTSKGSGGTLSFGGTPIAENIFRAAEVLGFDLNASFKGEPEALDELRKKASGKATANDNALEKLYTAIGEKQPTEKQIEEITRLAKENESLDQYKKTLTEFLKKKYDKSQVDPTEKDMEAAQLIGFNLNAAYKSEAEALDELRKKASGKTTANDNALEKLYSAIGEKQPTEKQIEEITRLAKENDSLDLYKKTLTEFLKKKYAVAKKGPRVIDVAGGDWKEQIANLGTASGPGGKKTVKKEPTLKELGVALDKTTQALRDAEEEYEFLRRTDAEDSTLKAVSKKIEKLKEEKVGKVVAYDKKREQEKSVATTTAKPSSVVRVDPLKAAREQEALRLVKENNPTLVPVIDILSPEDQTRLLTRKMTLFYNTKDNKHVPERITSLGKVVQGATAERTEYIVNVLKALSPMQRDSLMEYVKGLEMGARLSALSYVPNYLGIAKYKFPDLENVVPSTQTPSKKPVAKVKVEEIVSSPKVVPTVSTPEKKMTLKERMDLLGDQSKITGRMGLPLKGSGQKDEND